MSCCTRFHGLRRMEWGVEPRRHRALYSFKKTRNPRRKGLALCSVPSLYVVLHVSMFHRKNHTGFPHFIADWIITF